MSQRVTGVITVASGKGGVGKTTSVMNLAAALRDLGAFDPEANPQDVVIDMDYGASLTRTYGYDPKSGFAVAVLDGKCAIEDALHTTEDGIMLVPTDAKIGAEGKEKLQTWIAALRRLGEDRLVICDGSDDIFSTAVAASILASDVLAIPIQLSQKAYDRTWPEILGLIETAGHNPEIVCFGTMVDKRLRSQRATIAAIANDGIELASFVPRAEAINEADIQHKSLISFAPRSPAATAYRDLASNIYARLRKMHGAAPRRAGQATRPLPSVV
jgi:septum site-determining protein MinD